MFFECWNAVPNEQGAPLAAPWADWMLGYEHEFGYASVITAFPVPPEELDQGWHRDTPDDLECEDHQVGCERLSSKNPASPPRSFRHKKWLLGDEDRLCGKGECLAMHFLHLSPQVTLMIYITDVRVSNGATQFRRLISKDEVSFPGPRGTVVAFVSSRTEHRGLANREKHPRLLMYVAFDHVSPLPASTNRHQSSFGR